MIEMNLFDLCNSIVQKSIIEEISEVKCVLKSILQVNILDFSAILVQDYPMNMP